MDGTNLKPPTEPGSDVRLLLGLIALLRKLNPHVTSNPRESP